MFHTQNAPSAPDALLRTGNERFSGVRNAPIHVHGVLRGLHSPPPPPDIPSRPWYVSCTLACPQPPLGPASLLEHFRRNSRKHTRTLRITSSATGSPPSHPSHLVGENHGDGEEGQRRARGDCVGNGAHLDAAGAVASVGGSHLLSD